MLLRLLDSPKTMSLIAAELGVTASTATYQVTALASVTLVRRWRAGTTMLVERTARGDGLLALYEPRAERDAPQP